MKQELKEGESKGDAEASTGEIDFSMGSEGESCKEVDGKIVCGAYGYDQEMQQIQLQEKIVRRNLWLLY